MKLTFSCNQRNAGTPCPNTASTQPARASSTSKGHCDRAMQRWIPRQRDCHHHPLGHTKNDEEESENGQGTPLGGKSEASEPGSRRRFEERDWAYTPIGGCCRRCPECGISVGVRDQFPRAFDLMQLPCRPGRVRGVLQCRSSLLMKVV